MLSKIDDENEIYKILRRVGKISCFCYKYKNFDIVLENIIKIILYLKLVMEEISQANNYLQFKKSISRRIRKVAKNWLDYYSKLGEEYHIIDKERYFNDDEYKRMVLLSNELDNRVIIDIIKLC